MFIEYTRVKLSDHKPESTDYINASHIQYIDVNPASLLSANGPGSRIPQIESLASQNESTMSSRTYRRYISTQGPLPATFDDFYNVIWEQNSYVIVMLTKEEEMNRVSCVKELAAFYIFHFFLKYSKLKLVFFSS